MKLILALCFLAAIILLGLVYIAHIEGVIQKRNQERAQAIQEAIDGNEKGPVTMSASDYLNWLELGEAQRA